MRAASVLALFAVAPAVLAGPSFTSPVQGTSCVAGQACTISWQDDNIAPLLAAYGDCLIGIYTGSQFQQTEMQPVSPANAATTGSIVFVPDPNMGENSSAYFVKMISTSTPDPASPQYMATAYSAMFTLTGMTGTFNETVKAQIAGTAASSGAATGAPATTAAATTAAASSTGVVVTSVISKTASSSTHAATPSSSAAANGASSATIAGMGVFGATIAAVLASFL